MPSSSAQQISTIVEIIRATKPKSVLDIGIGFGKYGFLCREYLELWDGRDRYNDWQTQIDGIEAFEEYVTPLHRLIYSNIHIGDALVAVPRLTTYYDLILLIDVIEHFSIEDGQRLLRDCAHRGRACLVSTPLEVSAQGSAFGNAYETHRSQWSRDHFAEFPEHIIIPNPQSLLCYLRFDGARVASASA
ncbi:MAG: class I SAM-dependent methyltransferase [Candidatus Zixiibacteriota bacterium]